MVLIETDKKHLYHKVDIRMYYKSPMLRLRKKLLHLSASLAGLLICIRISIFLLYLMQRNSDISPNLVLNLLKTILKLSVKFSKEILRA